MVHLIRVVAVVLGLFALVFLFVGLLWTEWPQALVGVALGLAAAGVWTAGEHVATRGT